jgi:hypothetical protein
VLYLKNKEKQMIKEIRLIIFKNEKVFLRKLQEVVGEFQTDIVGGVPIEKDIEIQYSTSPLNGGYTEYSALIIVRD